MHGVGGARGPFAPGHVTGEQGGGDVPVLETHLVLGLTWKKCHVTLNNAPQVPYRENERDREYISMFCVLNIFNFSFSDAAPEWSGWSTWSGCTVLCGGGRRSRMRSCLNGNICKGEGQEYQDCNLQECPNCEPNVIN